MRRPLLLLLLLVFLVLTLAACGGDGSQRSPVSSADGLRANGTFDGNRINVDDGQPEALLGDCDAADGADGDFCIVTRTIGGSTVALVVENPQLLRRLDTIGVRDPQCQGFGCEAVDDFLVVEVRVDGASRRASSGTFEISRADSRYAGTFRLRFPDGGGLSGAFDVAVS